MAIRRHDITGAELSGADFGLDDRFRGVGEVSTAVDFRTVGFLRGDDRGDLGGGHDGASRCHATSDEIEDAVLGVTDGPVVDVNLADLSRFASARAVWDVLQRSPTSWPTSRKSIRRSVASRDCDMFEGNVLTMTKVMVRLRKF